MSVNSSSNSSFNSSSNSSSNSSLHPLLDCQDSISVFTAVFVTSIVFLLPLFILVLYIGFQRWRRQRSALMSHSDVFTFHMVALELSAALGSSLYCYGIYTNRELFMRLALDCFSILFPGQALFHLLTCVERYLAVVHPVTYRGLRQGGGVRIRNISIGCVWLICFASLALEKLEPRVVPGVFILIFCFIAVSFCSLSVLWVLIRPGPGEVGGNGKRVDQSKNRAFFTIMAILGALVLKFFTALVTIFLHDPSVFTVCPVEMWSSAMLSLPSSLVLPLLFVHRAGKLPGCKHGTESG